MNRHHSALLLACLSALFGTSCAAPGFSFGGPPTNGFNKLSDLDVQAVVMQMADDYSAALTESMNPIIQDPNSSSTARQLAQRFQRDGTGSAIDIAVGPNPDAGLLDMLVLVSLQRWAFNEHSIADGIPEVQGRQAAQRLEAAETSLWHTAASILSEEQQRTLRTLINDWIKANPDHFAVSFVRFNEFVNIRSNKSRKDRAAAEGLLREVSQASAAVDSVRLLGERALWYAGRYPYVLDQQVQSTLYRFADQPEFRSVVGLSDSVKQLSDATAQRMESFDRDMTTQQEMLFSKLTAERVAAIDDAKLAMTEVTRGALADLDTRLAAAREGAINQSFDRLAKERKDFLDDLQSREGELRTTIGASTRLATELTGTVNAIDKVIARFDTGSGAGAISIDFKDVRDAAIEATKAADKLTILLGQTNDLAGSAVWDQRIERLDHATSGIIDRAFWRALALVLIFLCGMAAIRLIPTRERRSV